MVVEKDLLQPLFNNRSTTVQRPGCLTNEKGCLTTAFLK
jgi:hypothetical protein